MGCGSCASGACGSIKKLSNKTVGCQNGGCASKGCNKMNNFDWLANMSLPSQYRFDVVEVKFKGGRKDFFRNTDQLEIFTGDAVVVEMPSGYHIGYVSMQGELVRLQMNRKEVNNDDTIRKLFRLATQRDLEKFAEVQQREITALYRTREIIKDLQLNMKLSDVEFQADNTKATFYYSSDTRVDFRELIKILAAEFKIRVDMRQISLRQEAGRLGGIGTCGRELCCSTWLTDFKNVNTSAARYQNISLNQAKLSGQCGRLKCCLNYELDTYMDALLDIPKVEKPLETEIGRAKLEKVDIFKKILWFSYDTESNWIPVTSEKAAEYIKMNESGKKAPALVADVSLSNVIVNESADKPSATRKDEHKRLVLDKKERRTESTETFNTSTNENTTKHKKKKKKKKTTSAISSPNPASEIRLAPQVPSEKAPIHEKRHKKRHFNKNRRPASGNNEE